MKTIYYAATVLAAFGLLAVTSCHKDAPVDPKIEFSANLPELTVGSMGGTLTIEFTSAAAWTARMSQAWCSVSPSEGDPGQCSATVTIGVNMSYETRTVDLKIISGTLEETLTITQIQNDAIVIAQDEYTVPSAGDTLEFVLNTNVDFVFYGMGCVDYGGAEAYRESLGESGRENTILAVTLDGLGGDELWMYFDETETAHGEFMRNIASTRGYGELVGEPPVMQADPAEALTDKLPYTPYALINESSLYFGSNNICTVTSGSDFTFLLGSEKWYGSSDAEYTSADTLATLEQNNPGYAEQMCIAADELTCSIFHPAFAEVCTQKNTSYAWLTGQIAAYVGGALLAAGLLVFTILMTRHLKKKYTDQGVRRNVKVAVFGMDYEDPEDGDVFVDTHPGGHDEEDPFGDDPFGGDDKGNGDNAKDK